jgi:hypothetical protein
MRIESEREKRKVRQGDVGEAKVQERMEVKVAVKGFHRNRRLSFEGMHEMDDGVNEGDQ